MSHHLSRKRDKPLRTYGRKSTSTPEPPTKRARTETEPKKRSSLERSCSKTKKWADEDEEVNITGAATLATEEATVLVQQPSRSSILQYFQPMSMQTKKATKDIKSEEEHGPDRVESLSTPQTCRSRRKPRLLRLRATSPPLAPPEEKTCFVDGDKRKTDASLHTGKRKSLHEAADSLLNQERRDGTSPDASPGQRTTLPKRSPTVQVQTTLNISSKAAFAECRVCDTVWNPLYPDDVKYHDKRHRLVMRAQKRKEDDL